MCGRLCISSDTLLSLKGFDRSDYLLINRTESLKFVVQLALLIMLHLLCACLLGGCWQLTLVDILKLLHGSSDSECR